jgi:hypothetical protein
MSACALQMPMRKCGFHIARLLQLAFLVSARRFGVYLLIVLGVVSNGCSAGVGKPMAPLSLVPPGQGISFPREYFGMHIHNAEKPGHWPAIPFGSWRLWDAYVGWADLQPAPDKWDFRRLDGYVDKAQSAGVSILLPLGRTPNWASARPTEHSPYGPGQAAEPANIEDWRNYVRTVVSRYRGRIPAYQILNEANLTMFWTGSIPKLVELTRVAHEEIKRIDPSAVLVSPSATGLDARIAWVRSFLDAGGESLVDVVSFHLYDNGKPPEAMIPKVQELRAQLKAGGYGGKPLWNTETGLLINNLVPAPDVTWSTEWWKQRLEPKPAADYVMRAFLISRALGFERYYWFAWDNRWFGLTEPAVLSPKAPAKAYAHAIVYLMRSTLERCDRDGDGLWVCRLKMANGRPAQALWMDPAAPLQRKVVPSPFSGKVVRFDGETSVEAPVSTTLSVGPGVSLVVQAP